jgi:hypothetical protein
VLPLILPHAAVSENVPPPLVKLAGLEEIVQFVGAPVTDPPPLVHFRT